MYVYVYHVFQIRILNSLLELSLFGGMKIEEKDFHELISLIILILSRSFQTMTRRFLVNAIGE